MIFATPRDRAGLLILTLALGVTVALAPFVSGLLGAAVLYVAFAPLYRWLAKRLSSAIAAALTLAVALLVVAVPFVWVVGLLIDQAPDALAAIQHSTVLTRASGLRIGDIDIGAEVVKAGGVLGSWISRQLFAFVGSATAAALNLVIAFFGLYYLLQSGGRAWASVREYIPFSRTTADALRLRFVGVTEAMLLGTAVVALVQGTVVGIGFGAVRLADPLFWGTVTAFASVLPVLGSALVWTPAALVLAAQGRYAAAGVMLAFGLVASNIDNLIRPLVYRRVSHIHPMVTLVGAFAGVRYYGLIGVLLGPLAIAYLFELLRFYKLEYASRAPDGERPRVALSHSS